MHVKVTPRGFVRYLRAFSRGAEAAIQRGLLSGAMRCVPILQRVGDEKGVFDTGNYRRRWRAEPIPGGARVYNLEPSAGVVEEGRRPGSRWPPRMVIERWAKRRLGLDADEARVASYPIARAIGIRGIAGRHVLRDALPEMVRAVTEELDRELDREAGA
jgi:hypothetical protein